MPKVKTTKPRAKPPAAAKLWPAALCPKPRQHAADQCYGSTAAKVFSGQVTLKEKLMPNGHLQEREDNVLSILINNPGFINQRLDAFEPLALEFTVLEEE